MSIPLPTALCLALLPLGAVEIEPRHPVIQAGETCAFRARAPGAGDPRCEWSVRGEGGAIGADGVFAGPPGTYRVRAALKADPADFAETGIAVLPSETALRIAAQVLGQDTFQPGWSEALPFRDLLGPGRFGDPGAVVKKLRCGDRSDAQILGYGLEVSIRWARQVDPRGAQLLSFLESWEPRRFEVTGLASLRTRVHGPVRDARVETLTRIAEGRWTSRTEDLSLWVRGLMPLAGNGLAGDTDGLGLAARFRRPEGLALLPDGAVAVADSQAHVIRVIHPDRGASTLCGSPGDSGHQDGDPASARFRGPAFLAAWLDSRPGPALVVSDSGNHVIRAVDVQGRVTTLAGVPGRAGHLDAPVARAALFQDPQGLAVDEAGNILVADRGNHVIRKISAEGEVTTLAGLPGSPGARDGAGPEARFADLRGLALSVNLPDRGCYNLYVVDGHSVRKVTPAGEVTVFCGAPSMAGPPSGSAVLPGRPCLNQPHGLAAAGNYLVVADRGNHAVQMLRPDWEGRAVCSTVAGDPALAVSRSGLLRCNIQGPLEEEYGALDQPLGVAVEPWGTIFVSDGAAVVQCAEPSQAVFLKPPVLVIPGGRVAAAGAPFTVGCSGPRPWGPELDDPHPFHWSLLFIDPRTGRPAASRIKGGGSGTGPEFAKVTLEEPGEVEVHLTCVTQDGLSLRCVEPMTVTP